MPKVHHFYLRRFNKSDSHGKHPFCTVGVGINPRTGNLHIGTLTLHSSDTHFEKAKARFLLPRKVFGQESHIVRTGDIHFDIGSDPSLTDFISDYVAHHIPITDRAKAQEMFMGIIRDAVMEYDVECEEKNGADLAKGFVKEHTDNLKKELLGLAIHEHGCAP